MKKIVYKSKAIQAIIVIITVGFIVSLYPLRLWHETVTAAIPMQEGRILGPIDDTRMVVQGFVAQYNHLGSIRLYLREETTGTDFYFRLLDAENRELFEEQVEIRPERLPDYYDITVDQELEVGELYHFILQGKAPDDQPVTGTVSNLYVVSAALSMSDYPYAGAMQYTDTDMEGLNIVVDYQYTVPLRKFSVAFYMIVAAAGAAVLSFLIRRFYMHGKRDRLITVEQAFKAVFNPLAAALVLAGLGAVVLQVFGVFLLDNVFFFISILLLGGILFYGINHRRDGQNPLMNKEIWKRKWPDYLQSVFLAAAIAACCEYMSGLYDIHHTIAERKEVIALALAMIVMLTGKELFRIYNLLYVILAAGYGYYYYQAGLTPEIKELDLEALKLTVWAGAFAGFVILNVLIVMIKKLVKKEFKRPAFLYGGLIVLFFALMIAFRNGRLWPVALAVSFALFYLQYANWRKKDILTNICRGIALHFIWSTGYALLHRPFVTFRTARYTHIFHTVTITATYLVIVESAAFVMFLAKWGRSRKLRDIWKESVFLGVVTSYMLFTMARTGFMTVAVIGVSAVFLMTAGKGMKRIRNMAAAGGFMILSAVICFPVTFFAQRTIPALVSDPILYEIESYPDEVMRGRKLDSLEFMRVGRFIDVFADKVFSLPEGTFDIYNEIKNFDETHIYVNEQFIQIEDARALGLLGEEETTVAQDKVLQETGGSMDEVVTEEDTASPAGDDNTVDYTNGRTDIFRSYYEQLNMTGHEEMGALLQDGSIATHAHNIYLQFAYDHGIPMGILFAIVGLITLIKSWFYYRANKDSENYAALPLIVTAAVAVEGLVEWVFHFSNPSGFIMMLVITPLIFSGARMKDNKDKAL